MIIIIALFVFTLLYFILLFPRLSERERILKDCPCMFAHRGYHDISCGIPENSMPAFRIAIQRGYGIELDLHLTKDGKLVVFHDNTLKRLCGYNRTIEDMTYEEIQKYPLLNTSEHIPLFQDVLSTVDGKVPLLIELKIPTKSLRICEEAYKALKHYSGYYLIQSFNTLGLRWFRLNAPSVLRGQLASHLTAENTKEAWIFKFLVQNLLCNIIGRPDFISYKMSDLPHLSVLILKYIFRTPIAVWTLTNNKALKKGIVRYDFQIFEKPCEIY